MAFQKTKKEPLHLLISKFALGFSFVASLITISIVSVYFFAVDAGDREVKKGPPSVKSILISKDGRLITDSETGRTILTMEEAQSYLKISGFAYDPETFQTSNAKYDGDCFTSAVLSSNKDKIVFSTGCLLGDLPQAWIGVYDSGTITKKTLDCTGSNSSLIPIAFACIGEQNPQPGIYFLIGGSGKNFVWSSDDKTITYEADLGLSGLKETRTIDSVTGEIIETNPATETKDWQDCKNEKYGYEVKYPLGWKVWLPGAPEARSANCNENLSLIAFSPNIYAYSDQQQINIDVYDQDRSRGTVWEGITSLGDYLNKKDVKIKKETTIDGERLIWVDTTDPQLITFYDGSIYNFSFNNIDDSTLDKFLNTFKFIDKDETADWQVYGNSETDFTFKYPKNWEISQDEFYETLGGFKATKRTVVLQKIGNKDRSEYIAINLRQFSCDHSGTCKDVLGNLIGTFSTDQETLSVLDQIISTLKSIEKDETADWKTYRNKEYGFQFEYPDSWGNPIVKNQAIDISDDVIKESVDSKDLSRIAKNELIINFDGKFCVKDSLCYSSIRIIEYNENNPLRIECYEGICNIMNLLEEKKQIENHSNILIGNLKGRLRDDNFVPGESYGRYYELILPKYEFIFENWYGYSDFSVPQKFQSIATRGDVFLEEISKANPEQKDFFDYLETLKKIVNTIKFTEMGG